MNDDCMMLRYSYGTAKGPLLCLLFKRQFCGLCKCMLIRAPTTVQCSICVVLVACGVCECCSFGTMCCLRISCEHAALCCRLDRTSVRGELDAVHAHAQSCTCTCACACYHGHTWYDVCRGRSTVLSKRRGSIVVSDFSVYAVPWISNCDLCRCVANPNALCWWLRAAWPGRRSRCALALHFGAWTLKAATSARSVTDGRRGVGRRREARTSFGRTI
eukprot:3529543-Prymnesium_polylepis.1